MCKGCHDHPQKTNKQKKEVNSSMTGKRLFTIVERPIALGATPGKSNVAAKNNKNNT